MSSELVFADIFQRGALSSDMAADDFKDVFKNASMIDFSTAEMNKLAGKQADFFIDAAGRLTKNPNGHWKPGERLNVEIDSNGSGVGSNVQSSVIQSIIDTFMVNHPNIPFPRTWQEVLEVLRNSMTKPYSSWNSHKPGATSLFGLM